jgi:hypothetical protein
LKRKEMHEREIGRVKGISGKAAWKVRARFVKRKTRSRKSCMGRSSLILFYWNHWIVLEWKYNNRCQWGGKEGGREVRSQERWDWHKGMRRERERIVELWWKYKEKGKRERFGRRREEGTDKETNGNAPHDTIYSHLGTTTHNLARHPSNSST